MKRIFTVLFIFLFIFSLTACGNNTELAKASDSNKNTAESSKLPKKLFKTAVEAVLSHIKENPEKPETPEKPGTSEKPEVPEASETPEKPEGKEDMKTMKLFIDEKELSVKWEDNESVTALRELVAKNPLSIQMSMYGGFEQVGSIGKKLPRNDVQTTTGAGDIVLYSGNQIVIFYGSNSWAYTRLGKVTDMSASQMSQLLGNGDVTLRLE